MPKFIVDFWLDGYESEAEMEKACEEFILEHLDFSASSVKVVKYNPTHTDPEVPSKGDEA